MHAPIRREPFLQIIVIFEEHFHIFSEIVRNLLKRLCPILVNFDAWIIDHCDIE